MGNGDPVTQEQFFDRMKGNSETMETNQKELIAAINQQAVKTASLEATMVGHYSEFDKRINGNKKAIDKIRDRLWAVAGAGGVTGTLAAIILKVISN